MRTIVRAPGCLCLIAVILVGCSDQTQIQRTVQAMGPQKLRNQAIETCRNSFPRAEAIKIAETNWLPAVRAFHPLSVWAEPDGAYLLLDSDTEGERGIYVPRLVPDKDPICGPRLKHVKLATGVYWYERQR